MKRCVILMFFLLGSTGVFASYLFAEDEVSKSMKAAKKAYRAKNYTEAVTQLQIAIQNIEVLVIEQLKSYLPTTFGDWQADDPEGGSAQGLGIFAGTTASRHYYKNDSRESVDVELVISSPMIATVRMWLTNPMLMDMSGGGKIVTVGKHKAVEKFNREEKSGELNILLGSAILVTIEGSHIVGAEVLYEFASKINLAKLEGEFEKK